MWCMAVQTIDVESLYAEAEARTRIKRETVARLQGITKGRLSQQLHGKGHPSFRALVAMWFHEDKDGERFVRALFQVTKERLGFSDCDPVPEAIGQALVVLGGLIVKLKMARAELPESNSQERRRA